MAIFGRPGFDGSFPGAADGDFLAGTENRVSVERTRFNAAVKDYNVRIRTFPSNIVAGMFGFTARKSFEAQAGAENAPKVKF